MKHLFEIRVLSQKEAVAQQLWASHIVSIVGSGETDLPEFFAGPTVETIVFDDLERERDEVNRPGARNAPKMKHVKAILEFTSQLSQGDRVIIHCHAGLCRSTAVAMLVMIQHGIDPLESLGQLLEIRSCAWPNSLVIRLGDAHLGLGNLLIDDLSDWVESEIEKIQDENIF